MCPLHKLTRKHVDRNPYPHPLGVTLAQRIDPKWTLASGSCDVCLDALQENAVRTEAEYAEPREPVVFGGWFSHVLIERERIRWNLCNPELNRAYRETILRDVTEATLAAGKREYFVIDGVTVDHL